MAIDLNAIAKPTIAPVSNTPYPQTMTPTAATSLVNQYGIDPTQVLSNQNITQTTTAPAPAPDDLLGIRADIYNKQGVNAAQTAYQQAMQAASSASLGLGERLTGLRGRQVSMSKITGTQAQERAVSEGEIDALNESARLAQSDYVAKKGNADEMFQIRNQEIGEKKAIMLQYPGAKVTFGDSMAQVTKKLTKYQDQVAKDEWKSKLKQMALSLGVKTSGSRKELEKRISKTNKKALDNAQAEHDLKMEQGRWDIKKTISDIKHAGDKSGSNDLVPYYVTSPDGTIQQAMNDDGTPVMIPKGSQIYNTKEDTTPEITGGETNSTNPSITGRIGEWWNSWSW